MQEESLPASCGGQQKQQRYRSIHRTGLYCMELIQPETGLCTHIYIGVYMPVTDIIPGFHVTSHSPHASGAATHAHEVGTTGEDPTHEELLLGRGSCCPASPGGSSHSGKDMRQQLGPQGPRVAPRAECWPARCSWHAGMHMPVAGPAPVPGRTAGTL